MANLSYFESMPMDTTDNKNLSVTEARNNFSQLVNRAAFGGEVTFIHGGRNHEPVAAIVPADLVKQYEALLDQEDGRIAMVRLTEIKDGLETTKPWDGVKRELDLCVNSLTLSRFKLRQSVSLSHSKSKLKSA